MVMFVEPNSLKWDLKSDVLDLCFLNRIADAQVEFLKVGLNYTTL